MLIFRGNLENLLPLKISRFTVVQNCLVVLPEPDNLKDHHAAVIHDCFEVASIVSLAALVVAEGSAFDTAFRFLHTAVSA